MLLCVLKGSIGLPDRSFKQGVDVLKALARSLGNNEEDIKECHEAPPGEEKKSTPVVGLSKERWHTLVKAKVEQPVEELGERRTEGPEVIGPNFSAKYVGKNKKAF